MDLKKMNLALALTAATGFGLLTGCEQEPQTPAEQAGDAMERAGENLQDAAENAGDRTENAMENAAENAENAAENAQDAMN